MVDAPAEPRWVEVSPSSSRTNRRGWTSYGACCRTRPRSGPGPALPRDNSGKWNEVDLLVLGRGQLHLMKLKYYSAASTE